MSLLPKVIIINLKSILKYMKEYHITLSMLFFSLWYQINWKKQLEILFLPHIKFSCILKQVSYILLKWHLAPSKKLTKVTVHTCTMFESQLAQVYQKLTSYTVEPNKFTQDHLCPDSKPNKLFQVIQLLGSLKYRKIEKPVILSFSSASAMIHYGSSGIDKITFPGSAYRMSQHSCVPGRTPIIPYRTAESAGLADSSMTLYGWYTHKTLLSLIYLQILLYLLQVFLIFNITAQSFFITFLKVLSSLSGDSFHGIFFNVSLFFIFIIILRFFFMHRDFLNFGHFSYILSGSLGIKITEILYFGGTLSWKPCHLGCTLCFPLSPPLVFLQNQKMQKFIVFSVWKVACFIATFPIIIYSSKVTVKLFPKSYSLTVDLFKAFGQKLHINFISTNSAFYSPLISSSTSSLVGPIHGRNVLISKKSIFIFFSTNYFFSDRHLYKVDILEQGFM